MRFALAAISLCFLPTATFAQDIENAALPPTFEYCARVVSIGVDSIEPEAAHFGLTLGPWQAASEVSIFGDAVSYFAQGARVRVASSGDNSAVVGAVVSETALMCIAGVGADDESLARAFVTPTSEWQFAFRDRLVGTMVFDWPGVENGQSVRAMRFPASREVPFPVTVHSPAPTPVGPSVSDVVRASWVLGVLDTCLAGAHAERTPEVDAFATYLAPLETDDGSIRLRSLRGQPQADLVLGGPSATCVVIGSGQQGALLLAAFAEQLSRRSTPADLGDAVAFTIPAPTGAERAASVLLRPSVAGRYVILILSERP